jgi:polysaccharide biosynthesis transport protein
LRTSRNLLMPPTGEHRALPGPAPILPAQYVQNTLSSAQILGIIRAHRRQAWIISLLLIALTVVVVKFMPKSYTAQATIQVNFEGGDGTHQVPPEVFNSYLVTQVDLLQSRGVLMSAIDKLGLTHDPEFAAGYKDNGINNLPEWVANQLSAKLKVDQGKGSQLVYVSLSDQDRTKAANIVNAVVAAYQARQSISSDDPTSGRAHDYNEQLNDLKTKLTAAEGRMADFRQRAGITDLNAQTDVETQGLSALEQQLLIAQQARHTAESRSGDQSASSDVMASQLIQSLKTQLSTQQSELAQASSTLGPKHPKVLELESQIAATRQALSRELSNYSQNNTGQLTSAVQLEQKTQKAIDEQRAKVIKVRQLQDEGQKLSLELQSAQTVYKRALDGYDQVMFASTSIVSKATPPIAASKPNKMALLLGGILLSILVGVGIPLARELMTDRRLHCRDDIERDLGLPVLAELGRLTTGPGFT